jgi:sec-independent protein translocase protein TatB
VLDFGWAELLIIMAVAVFVIGPKDIPKIMYGVGRVMRRIQYVRFAVSQQFEEMMQAGDLEELQRGVNFEQKRSDESVQAEAEEDEAYLSGEETDFSPVQEKHATAEEQSDSNKEPEGQENDRTPVR